MNRVSNWVLCGLLLTGCGAGVDPSGQLSTLADGQTRADVVSNGPALISGPDNNDVPPDFDMAPYRESTGAIVGFNVAGPASERLVPGDTQSRADSLARSWAPDAKQVYIGWGYRMTALLGQTQHVYYSPGKRQKLTVTFKLTPWSPSTAVTDAPNYDRANKVLKQVDDVYHYRAETAHDQAIAGGYHPSGPNDVGVLINPIVLGPLWVFLDNDTHQYPLVAVNANTGNYINGGLEMMAIRYMFSQQ